MDRGAWRATVPGVARVGHDLVPKPPADILELSSGSSLNYLETV